MDVERFWDRVDANGDDECWPWLGGRTKPDWRGYGTVWTGEQTTTAHRVAYELLVGPVPEGLTLDHLCRNRLCVNPAHLEPVSQTVNSLRGRHPHAERSVCPRGHPYEGSNVYLDPRGSKRCRACARTSRARYRYRPTEEKA